MSILKLLFISCFFVTIFVTYYVLHSPTIAKIHIQNITTSGDIDRDGINDIEDILEWARAEIKNKTQYKSAYYAGGYPPENEGVCTDVVWRALQNAGIDIKSQIDLDIQNNTEVYTRVAGKPDPNIDFRRVPNLDTFLKRYTTSLTTKIIPEDIVNLSEWQPGDIVMFSFPNQHTGIISDKRDTKGVPYIIHNYSDFPREDVWVFYADKKKFPIIGHYRWKY